MRKRIRILVSDLNNHVRAEQIVADVFGIWAAHPSILTIIDSGWRVTHVPTGMALDYCVGLDARDAKSIARTLSRRIPHIEVRGGSGNREDGWIIDAIVAECLCEGSAP